MLCRDFDSEGFVPVRLLALICLAILCGCDVSGPRGDWMSAGGSSESRETVTPFMTIGDIEPDTPTDRMLKLRPLADHIALAMGWEPGRVQVRIARSVPEITAMMKDGLVDLYIDSSYPVLLVCEDSGAEVAMESPIEASRTYNSVIIASVDSDVRQLEDLRGRIVGLQEFYSTSGYLLPASHLIQAGFELEYTSGRSQPEPDRVGFFFSGDEENSLSMLQQGVIDAGAMSGLDWARLPDEIRNEFVVLVTTKSVPRKMLAIRQGFDRSLLEPLSQALLSITDEQRRDMITETGWSWEFMALDAQSMEGIARTRQMIEATREVMIR